MEVSPIELCDLGELSLLHKLAFIDDDFQNLIFPPRLHNADIPFEARCRRFASRMQREIEVLHLRLLAHKVTSSEGKLLGYAMWLAPEIETKQGEQSRDGSASNGKLVENPEEELFLAERDDAASKRFRDLTDPLKESHVPGPKWYLNRLCTRPGYERQGVGSLLMQTGLEYIDKQSSGLPILLCASRKGKGLYEKFGFTSFAEVSLEAPGNDHGVSGPRQYRWDLMVRQPNH